MRIGRIALIALALIVGFAVHAHGGRRLSWVRYWRHR